MSGEAIFSDKERCNAQKITIVAAKFCERCDASAHGAHDECVHIRERPSVFFIAFWVKPINRSNKCIESLHRVAKLREQLPKIC